MCYLKIRVNVYAARMYEFRDCAIEIVLNSVIDVHVKNDYALRKARKYGYNDVVEWLYGLV